MGHCRTSAEQATKWRDAGIPDGYTISQLLFNPASQVVVIEVRGMKDNTLPERLLARHVSAGRYEPIGNPEEDVSFESPITCEKHPLVVFNSKRWRRGSDGSRRGKDWEGLYVLNLQTKELSLCVSGETLIMPVPYDERGWITEVLGLSDDGCQAYVRAGLGRRQDEGETKNVYYDYHVARLDLKSRRLDLISHLKNTWF